jgi:DNA polymerase elongation subunit (family B)
MKRECISNKTIVVAKKRYVMNVLDKEGTRYSTPKLKVQGIEAVRSSTPTVCRENIKKSLSLIMSGDIEAYRRHVNNFKEEFFSLPFEDVAKPSGVSEISKYEKTAGSCPKGTPQHVRAAITFNGLLMKHNLTEQYPRIQDGEKIKYCYMKMPNPTFSKVFGTNGPIPDCFDVRNYIDYETQFTKTFLDPIVAITKAAGITLKDECNLEGVFCW